MSCCQREESGHEFSLSWIQEKENHLLAELEILGYITKNKDRLHKKGDILFYTRKLVNVVRIHNAEYQASSFLIHRD